MPSAPVVIDCRAHLVGRLASVIAKQLLMGQRIVAVRCELLEVSGSLTRNKTKFANFLKKRTLTNPKKGPIHFRHPSKVLWRTVRGMLPHKTARGKTALERLSVFEGIPAPFDKSKRLVVPQAMRALRLKTHRRSTVLARLCTEFGWKHRDLVTKLEDQRKIKSGAYYEEKKATDALRVKALKAIESSDCIKQLKQYGY